MHNRPPVESSVALRALITAKRKRGQMVEALVLARLGVRIATRECLAGGRDEMSRIAFTRYLELMPDDDEVQGALRQLGTSTRPVVRRSLLWSLFVCCGLSAAGAIHLHGLPPLFRTAQASVPVATVSLPQPISASSVAAAATVPVKKLVVEAPPIVIRAVGDVVLGSDFPRYRLPGEEDRMRMAALRKELRNADIVVGNLEGVLSDGGKSHKDTAKRGLYTFRMPEGYAATLREMGFDVLSLANNHSMDFGAQGLESTVNALKAEGIQPVGVPGAEVAVVKVRDRSVAFLNYSYLPAFARLDDEERVRAEIRKARATADLAVVTVHGGKEGTIAVGAPSGDEYFMDEYRGDILKFSRLAIDAGASAVFGHGPHVVRPFEVYKGKPIFFSLGNFVGYRSLSTKGKLAHSIVAEVRFSPEGKLLGAGVIPLKLDKSGIPAADYSVATLDALDVLLDEQLEKRPVLELAIAPVTEAAPVAAASATASATDLAALKVR